MVSERKKKNMRYGAIIGAVMGVAIFAATYTVDNSLIYLIFIPIAMMMGWATQFVRDDEDE